MSDIFAIGKKIYANVSGFAREILTDSGKTVQTELDEINQNLENKIGKWKVHADRVTGTSRSNPLDLPTEFDELYCFAFNTEPSNRMMLTIPKLAITKSDGENTFISGWSPNGGSCYIQVVINALTNKIWLNGFYDNGSVVSNGKFSVYYR